MGGRGACPVRGCELYFWSLQKIKPTLSNTTCFFPVLLKKNAIW